MSGTASTTLPGTSETSPATSGEDSTTGTASDESTTRGESTGTASTAEATAGDSTANTSTADSETASTTGPDAFSCSGCAVLFVPLTGTGMATEFEINYGDDAAIDLSNTVITYRFHVETEGNAGGIVLYVKNGSRQSYRALYRNWTDFSSASSGFIEVDLDLRESSTGETETGSTGDSDSSTGTGGSETSGTGDTGGSETGSTGESGGSETGGTGGGSSGETGSPLARAQAAASFDSTDVVYVGLQVSAGTESWGGAMWGDTTVYLDSITFSDGASPDVTFDASLSGMSINNYNSPVAGSAVSHSP